MRSAVRGDFTGLFLCCSGEEAAPKALLEQLLSNTLGGASDGLRTDRIPSVLLQSWLCVPALSSGYSS